MVVGVVNRGRLPRAGGGGGVVGMDLIRVRVGGRVRMRVELG